jgi:uncharacterized protein (UPF0303 family)
MDKDEALKLLPILLREEEELQFERFGNEDALQVGLQLVDAVKKLEMPAAVSIVRCGQQLFQHALTGATPDHAEWIRRKENVVLRFRHSSYYMGTYYRGLGSTFEEQTGLDSAQFAAHGGCFPIIIAGTGVVGTVTVSGMPQAQDHAVVTGALRAFLLGRRS